MSALAKPAVSDARTIADSVIRAATRAGADQADAVIVDSTSLSCGTRLGKRETLERSESMAVGLRVWKGARVAVVSSSDYTKENLQSLAERAVTMAATSTEDPYTQLADKSLWPREIPELDLLDSREPSADWLLEQAKIAEETALETRGVTNSKGADAGYGRSEFTLATSHGLLASYAGSHFSISAEIVAGSGEDMHRDYDYVTTCHREDLPDAHEIGKNAAARAVARLDPKTLPSRQMPVIFDPRAGRSLLSSFASAISGNAIARGTSFLKDSMGQGLFPKTIQIIDDPLRRRGMGSHPFDAEGVEVQKRSLIEQGELKTWLLDIRSAAQLKLTTTGSASRGLSSPPYPSTSNLYLEAGKISKEAMLKEIKEGFYITELSGMGVNLVTGDYSQGAAGFYIRDGEIAYAVAAATIAGNMKHMFLNLTPANDLEFRYATNVPTLRVDGMTVAGS
ncbi:MAG: TldD/PmbA family protein [Rickettsiales bacterium]